MIILDTPIATIAGRRYCITTVSAVNIIAVIDNTEFNLLGGTPVTGQAEFIAPCSSIGVRSTAPTEEPATVSEEPKIEPSAMFGDSQVAPVAASASVPGNIVEIIRG